jgi:hypothetical protein
MPIQGSAAVSTEVFATFGLSSAFAAMQGSLTVTLEAQSLQRLAAFGLPTQEGLAATASALQRETPPEIGSLLGQKAALTFALEVSLHGKSFVALSMPVLHLRIGDGAARFVDLAAWTPPPGVALRSVGS